MRVVLVALLLLPALIPPAASAEASCSLYSHTELVVPNANYYVSVDRQRCTTTTPVTEQHKESVLITRGISAPGSVIIAQLTVLSARTGHAGGAGSVTDTITLTAEQGSASASYRSTRDAAGFTTCFVRADVIVKPSTSVGGSTPTLNACAPQDQLLI